MIDLVGNVKRATRVSSKLQTPGFFERPVRFFFFHFFFFNFFPFVIPFYQVIRTHKIQAGLGAWRFGSNLKLGPYVSVLKTDSQAPKATRNTFFLHKKRAFFFDEKLKKFSKKISKLQDRPVSSKLQAPSSRFLGPTGEPT